jgi:alpha-tubulin suppressor-like RCC1 family protein
LAGIQSVAESGSDNNVTNNLAAYMTDGNGFVWGDGYSVQSYGQYTSPPIGSTSLIPTNVTKISANPDGDSPGILAIVGGIVYARGNDAYGQLGNGSVGYISSYSWNTVSNLRNIVDIACGDTSYAVDSSGNVWVWGQGGDMSGINASLSDITTPQQISSLKNIVAIASDGTTETLALDSQGHVWLWGTGHGIVTPVEVNNYPNTGDLSNLVAIACGGGNYALAIDNQGHVWNLDGSFITNGSSFTFIPTEISGLSNIVGIAASASNGFALDSTGYVWAWGSGSTRYLGNGSKTDSFVPTKVSGGPFMHLP